MRSTIAAQSPSARRTATSSSANGTRFEIAVSVRWRGGYKPREYHRSTAAGESGAPRPTSAATTTPIAKAVPRLRLRAGGGMRLGRGLRLAGDQADGALVAEIRPRPLDEDDQPVAEADQV